MEEILTSLEEKNATASGSIDPARSNDTKALNFEGTYNTVTRT
jgi:hypothetical protein